MRNHHTLHRSVPNENILRRYMVYVYEFYTATTTRLSLSTVPSKRICRSRVHSNIIIYIVHCFSLRSL